jgi:hypothetical protein
MITMNMMAAITTIMMKPDSGLEHRGDAAHGPCEG